MKKILLGLIAILLFSCAGTAQIKIGEDRDGKFVVTENLDKLKTDWQAILKKQKNDTQLVNFQIVSAVNKKTEETYYMLIGKNEVQTTTVAVQLRKIGGRSNLYLTDNADGTSTGTVTCTGCSYACNPEKIGDEWMCSSGCNNEASCQKSVTITTK